MKIEFAAADQLSAKQKESLKQLRAAVYPAAALATLIGKDVTWASPQWSVLVWDEDELVSRVGLIQREIISNGETKTIGGIGGVMTHPERQSKGFASEAMREAVRHFDEWQTAYALLFCGSRLIEYYKRLDWKPFEGSIYVEQPRKGKIEFSANNTMVLDVKEQAPVHGTLDLNGWPW